MLSIQQPPAQTAVELRRWLAEDPCPAADHVGLIAEAVRHRQIDPIRRFLDEGLAQPGAGPGQPARGGRTRPGLNPTPTVNQRWTVRCDPPGARIIPRTYHSNTCGSCSMTLSTSFHCLVMPATVALFCLTATGCSRVFPVATAEPEPVPEVVHLPQRTDVPQHTQINISIVVPRNEAKTEEGSCVLKKSAKIPVGASVVINKPKFSTGKPPSILSEDEVYGIFERRIEKALIELDFSVLDRLKFEAQMRDARAAVTRHGFYDEDPAFAAASNKLKKKLDTNEITEGQYMEDMNRLRAVASPRGSQQREEIWDPAELVRATQGKGEVKSDYLLQIDRFASASGGGRYFSLETLAIANQIQQQLADPRFRAIGRGAWSNNKPFAPNTTFNFLPTKIPMPWYTSDCSAKMIDLRSGDVVWVGQHTSTSQDAVDLQLSFTVSVELSEQSKRIVGEVTTYNDQLDRVRLQCLNARNGVLAANEAAARNLPDIDLNFFAIRRTWEARVAAANNAYKSSLEQLRAIEKPNNGPVDWTYSYQVSGWKLEPDLSHRDQDERESEVETRERRDRISKHLELLSRSAARTLLGTIRP